MQEVAAYSTVAVTLGLVVTRPRLSASFRLSPAVAALGGVAMMAMFGVVSFTHLRAAATNLWSPLLTIAAIMVMTEVATRVALLDQWATRVETRATSSAHLFFLVFALGVLTSSLLNNDAAILLLTPLVVALVRRRYPNRPELIVPFAFAVFMSAGVAALPVSNPMNMVVAEFAGIGFNHYAVTMIPVAIIGWVVAFLILRRMFARQLSTAPDSDVPRVDRRPTDTGQRAMMVLLLCVLPSYSAVGYFGGPVWAVATVGAIVALALGARFGNHRPASVVARGVSWETLAFLLAVLVLSLGLREVGLVDRLAAHYAGAGVGTVGVTSALGSAVLNNHPMAHLNMMALEGAPGDAAIFAALVGGDLGPRLLPMGSLAGLLWIDILRRQGVEIRLGTFVKVGVIVTVPAISASLLWLSFA